MLKDNQQLHVRQGQIILKEHDHIRKEMDESVLIA